MPNPIIKNLKIGDTVYALGGQSSNNEEDNPVIFKNKTVPSSSFSPDNSLNGYNFKASLSLEKITQKFFPLVIFSIKDAVSGNFAPIAESYDGGIYIYVKEKPQSDIIIPTIVGYK